MEEIEEWENILVPTVSAARQTSILPWNMRIKSEDFSDGIMETGKGDRCRVVIGKIQTFQLYV